jgi:hypothetical protein
MIASLVLGFLATIVVAMGCAVLTQSYTTTAGVGLFGPGVPVTNSEGVPSAIIHGWPGTESWPGPVPPSYPQNNTLSRRSRNGAAAFDELWRRSTFFASEQYAAADLNQAEPRNYLTTMYGWPARALRNDEIGREPINVYPTGWPQSAQGLREGYRWQPPIGGQQSLLVLPRFPVVRGILLDTAFYAAIVWFGLALIRKRRDACRVRAGECPKCRYAIGRSPACTECGADISAVAVRR